MEDFCRFALSFYSANESTSKDYENVYENIIHFITICFSQMKSSFVKEIARMDLLRPLTCKLVSDLCYENQFVVTSVFKILLCISNFPESIFTDIILSTPILSVLSRMLEATHKNRIQIFRLITNYILTDDNYISAILNEPYLVEHILHTINITPQNTDLLEEGLHTIRNILRQRHHPSLIPFVMKHFTAWDIIYTKISPKSSFHCLMHIHEILESLYKIGYDYSNEHNVGDNLFIRRVMDSEDLREFLERSQEHPDQTVYEKYYRLINVYFCNSI